MRLGEGEGGRGVGDVPHLRLDALLLGVRDQLAEEGELGGDGGVAGLVGAGEVRPQAGDADLGGGEGGLDERGPVGGLAAVAPEPGVGLELDPGDAPGGPSALDGLFQGPHPTHRHVDVGLDGLAPGPAGRPEPAEHPPADPGRAQRQGLVRGGGADPGGARLDRGPGARHGAVPVRVRLHDGHELRAGGTGAQRTDVGAQGGQIDLGARSRVHCLSHRGHRAKSLRAAPPAQAPGLRPQMWTGSPLASAPHSRLASE